jgi:pimeloyl-ACP methyl ester carboxylesterase
MTWTRLAASLLLAAALGAGAVAWRAAARERAAEAAFPPLGQFVTVEGLKVHAVVMGEGPDLVLLHGLSANARDFTFSLAPRLARSYRVIVFDRPGLGFSDPLPPGDDGIFDHARLLHEAAAALGAEKPIVVGQSYGGAVALAWALDYPESAAAMVSIAGPSHPWDTGMSAFYRLTSNPVGAALAVPLIAALTPQARIDDALGAVFEPQEPPPGYDAYIGAPLALRRQALRVNARHRAQLLPEIEAMVPRYPTLTLPIEIVHGDADDTVAVAIHGKRLVQDVPSARLTILPGIGHAAHHAAEDEVVAAIDRAATRAGLR